MSFVSRFGAFIPAPVSLCGLAKCSRIERRLSNLLALVLFLFVTQGVGDGLRETVTAAFELPGEVLEGRAGEGDLAGRLVVFGAFNEGEVGLELLGERGEDGGLHGVGGALWCDPAAGDVYLNPDLPVLGHPTPSGFVAQLVAEQRSAAAPRPWLTPPGGARRGRT